MKKSEQASDECNTSKKNDKRNKMAQINVK